MSTCLYAVLLTFLLLHLLINIAKKGSLGDGEPSDIALQRAVHAHGDLVETIPLFLIFLGLVEYNGTLGYLIQLLGIVFTIGCIVHALALKKAKPS